MVDALLREVAGRKLTDDEWGAHCFLVGYDRLFSASGRPISCEADSGHDPVYTVTTFLTGKDEAYGREALVRLLSSNKPLLNYLQHILADLVATDSPEERRLKFQRPRNRPNNISSKPLAVARRFIEEQKRRGMTLTDAIERAQDVFDYKDARSIKKVLQKRKQEWLEGPVYRITMLKF